MNMRTVLGRAYARTQAGEAGVVRIVSATAVFCLAVLVLSSSSEMPVEDYGSTDIRYDIQLRETCAPGEYRVYENGVSGTAYLLDIPRDAASPILEIYRLPADINLEGAGTGSPSDMRLSTLRETGRLLGTITPGSSLAVDDDAFTFAFVFGDDGEEIGVDFSHGEDGCYFNTHSYAYPSDAGND